LNISFACRIVRSKPENPDKRDRRARAVCGLSLCLVLLAGCGRQQQPEPGPAPSRPRLVTLAPNLTEIVCAVGGIATLVGRSSACDYPPELTERVPVVGDFGVPSLERIVAVRPTHVLFTELADASVLHRTAELGLSTCPVPCAQLDDIPPAIRTVGGYAGCSAAAQALAAELADRVAELRARAAAVEDRPRVFVEIWGDPLTTAGKSSFLSELVRLAGGANLGDDSPAAYFQVSSEWVVAQDPERIVCLYMGREAVRNLVLKRAGWQGISAVRSGRVYDGLPNALLLRPGPRVLEGVAALARCIREEQ